MFELIKVMGSDGIVFTCTSQHLFDVFKMLCPLSCINYCSFNEIHDIDSHKYG